MKRRIVTRVLDVTPGYPPDQVPRRLTFEAAHPEVKITFRGPYWRAAVPRPGSEEEVITRLELRALLDVLEQRPEFTRDAGRAGRA